MKLDRRYSINREYTGHISRKQQYVARFVGEWIGSSSTRAGAVKLAEAFEAARQREIADVTLVRRDPNDFRSMTLAEARSIAVKEQKKRVARRSAPRKKKAACSCHAGPKRDVPVIRKVKKKIAVFRLKRALSALWAEGRHVNQKAKDALARAREVAILSGVTPAQLERIKQEVAAFLKDQTQKLYEKRRATKKRPALLSRDPAKTCPIGTEIQTLVLSQQFFNERQATGWIKRHGFRAPKIDVTANNYRFRQHPPSNFQPGSFRTIRLRPGVEAVIGCPQ